MASESPISAPVETYPIGKLAAHKARQSVEWKYITCLAQIMVMKSLPLTLILTCEGQLSQSQRIVWGELGIG
jgi:hypothetical protein